MNTKIFNKIRQVVFVSAFALMPSIAHAQAVDVPGSADAGRVGENIMQPGFDSGISAQIDIPTVQLEGAPAGAESTFLTLTELEIEGNTVYTDEQLREIYAPFIGERIALTKIFEIAEAITVKYRSEGFLITQTIVPQQTIDQGKVRLRVVEGFINDVIIDSPEDSLFVKRIAQYGDGLKAQRPLTAQNLERWLLLINDIPGISARSIIRPSADTVGGADIIIVPTEENFEMSFSVDNYGSRFLGPVLGSAAFQSSNFFDLGERVQVQAVKTMDDSDLVYGSIRAEMPVNAYGTYVGISASHSDTDPGFTLDVFDVEGKSSFVGLDAKHPIIRSRSQNLYGFASVDYRRQESSNIVETFDRIDRLYVLRGGLSYDMLDSLWMPAFNEVEIQVSKGINVFGASQNGETTLSRGNANPQFTKIEAEALRLQSLTSNLNLLAGVKGQWASTSLPSAEEFGIGGRDYGRGYDPSELVGDHGLAAKFELQLNTPVSLNETTNGVIPNYQLFGFYDVGTIWNDNEIVNNIQRSSLASAGIGLRTDILDNFSAELLATVPLTKDVTTRSSTDPRFFFSVSADF